METLNCCVVRAVQVRLTAMARSRRARSAGGALLAATLVAVAASGAAAATGVVGTGAAAAQSACSTPVVDTSGTLDTAALTRAVEAETRARIVIRAYRAAPGGRLTDATNELLAGCFTTAGKIDPLVAVLSFSVDDRQNDVYLGQGLPGAPLPNELQTDMTDGFKAGRLTAGVMNAVQRLGRALDDTVGPRPTTAGDAAADTAGPAVPAAEATTPASAGITAGVGADTAVAPAVTAPVTSAVTTAGALAAAGGDVRRAPAGTGATAASPAADEAGAVRADRGTLLAGGAAAVAALVLGAGISLAVGRRRRLQGQRRELERALAEPVLRAGAIRERNRRLDARAEVWSAAATGRTRSALDDVRRATREAGAATERNAALLAQATPRGVDRASGGELESATARLANLVACLDANQRALDALEGLGARLDHLRVTLPARRELLFGEVAAAETLSDQRHGEGWKVDEPEAALGRIRSLLDALDPAAGPGADRLDLSDRLEGAEADLFATIHDLQGLPDRPGSVIAWRERQTELAELEERRAEALIAKLAETTAGHAPESWQGLSGHPDRALALIREATERADTAIELARFEQRFDDAGKALEDAGLDLMAADELLDQVDDLLVDLRRARAEAPGIVALGRHLQAEVGALAARQGLGSDGSGHPHDAGDGSGPDVELAAAPARMATVLEGLERELRSARPNFLRVARTGDQLNREADLLLAPAQPEEVGGEARSRQAAREVERAGGALGRARESLSWELTSSGDGQVLDDLGARLADLPEEPAERRDLARAVADQALIAQERIIARRRRRGSWIVLSPGTGGWRGGGWSPGVPAIGRSGGPARGGGGPLDTAAGPEDLDLGGSAGVFFASGRPSGGW